MDTKSGLVTSYSDYMRCLAAKYSDNIGPTTVEPPVSPAIARDLLPILAARQTFKATQKNSLPLLTPFPLQVSENKSHIPGLLENVKRHKEDPLDLTDKMKKLKEESKSPSPVLNHLLSPTPHQRPMTDWSVEDVASFVAEVNDCGQYSKVSVELEAF